MSASQTGPLMHHIRSKNEQITMIINTSRVLVMDKKIPAVQTPNPEILQLTPLGSRQIQVLAKKVGVTQINLWDDSNQIYTIDVVVNGDVRELKVILDKVFPNAMISLEPLPTSVLIRGRVENAEDASRIIAIAKQYYSDVIDDVKVGGIHQVLLHVRVMEISRTKLRALGIDWSVTASGGYAASLISGLAAIGSSGGALAGNGSQTFQFGVLDNSSPFYAMIEALRQDNLLKVLAEPTLVTTSGRAAFFQVGGEIPILVPQSQGQVLIEWKPYGTQVDFVPIVYGNGRIHLEVRPRISELDPTRAVQLGSFNVPAVTVREVDTGVDLRAGQTLAIAGLVENRLETEMRGVPYLCDLPYVGTMFRRIQEKNNEIELLILVTPQLIAAMDPEQVPTGGPGLSTSSPSDEELYFRGYRETPNCCPPDAPAQAMPIGHTMGIGDRSMVQPIPIDPDRAVRREMFPPRNMELTSGSPQRAPVPPVIQTTPNQHDRYLPNQPRETSGLPSQNTPPGFMGPIGFDEVE